MNHLTKSRKRTRGITLVEVLVASLVVGTSMAGLVDFAYVDYNMTTNSTNITAAESCARAAIEEVRLQGFANAAEGSSTVYCDANGDYPASTTQLATSIYSIQTTVTSDILNGGVPATTALRTVTVTVSLISSGVTVYQTYTSLANGGV